jgi:hypothetical protein
MPLKVKRDIQSSAFSPRWDAFNLIVAKRVFCGLWRFLPGRGGVTSRSAGSVALAGCLGVVVSRGVAAEGLPDDPFNSGPIYDRFRLTLEPGTRSEWAGPLYFRQEAGDRSGWGIPPLVTWEANSGTDSAELDILYPLLTYDRFGSESRWQLFQWLNFSGNRSFDDSDKRRFSLFPFYLQQRSSNPTNNYTAVIPFYGHLQNRFFRDEVHFVLMPLYVQSRKGEMITDNYVYPFFHLRHGPGLRGWQFWPVMGSEHKSVTQRTNHWDEVEELPGHEKFFAAWPFFFKERAGIGTTNEQRSLALVPVFSSEHSALRDSVGFPWPLGFRRTEDREKQYREWDAPWPFIVFARGKGKHTDRVWPIFSQSRTPEVETDFYAWPLYKSGRVHASPYDRDFRRILFFLYSDLRERNLDTREELRRRISWPLFVARREYDGRRRVQVLALLEPFLPTSRSIERDYSPVWSVWRSEVNPKTGASSQSLLWNLYRRDRTPEVRKCSLLFGLFQYQTGSAGRRTRLFYIPLGGGRATTNAVPAGTDAVTPKP